MKTSSPVYLSVAVIRIYVPWHVAGSGLLVNALLEISDISEDVCILLGPAEAMGLQGRCKSGAVAHILSQTSG